MKQKNIIGRLIGKFIKVKNAKNKNLVDFRGVVIDETKNTITIQAYNKKIKLIKSQIEIENGN